MKNIKIGNISLRLIFLNIRFQFPFKTYNVGINNTTQKRIDTTFSGIGNGIYKTTMKSNNPNTNNPHSNLDNFGILL